LRIAQWEAGSDDAAEEQQRTSVPISVPLSAHLQECARCRSFTRELAAARSELLGNPSHPAAEAVRTIEHVAAARHIERRRRRLRFLSLAAAPVLAGAAAMFLVIPRFVHRPAGAEIPQEAAQARVRSKGGLVMEAYCKRQDAVFTVEDGARFYVGDRLRFAYTAPAAGYLMIFGVDDGGRIFPYYDEGKLAGIPVAAGARTMLPGSVGLDEHHGLERVFALWSDKPIKAELIRKAVAAGLAGGDVGRLTQLPIPADQISYLLRRP
jgi:hypothetical protein